MLIPRLGNFILPYPAQLVQIEEEGITLSDDHSHTPQSRTWGGELGDYGGAWAIVVEAKSVGGGLGMRLDKALLDAAQNFMASGMPVAIEAMDRRRPAMAAAGEILERTLKGSVTLPLAGFNVTVTLSLTFPYGLDEQGVTDVQTAIDSWLPPTQAAFACAVADASQAYYEHLVFIRNLIKSFKLGRSMLVVDPHGAYTDFLEGIGARHIEF